MRGRGVGGRRPWPPPRRLLHRVRGVQEGSQLARSLRAHWRALDCDALRNGRYCPARCCTRLAPVFGCLLSDLLARLWPSTPLLCSAPPPLPDPQDIQDSTQLWEALPAAVMDLALNLHNDCVRQLVRR